MICQYRSNTRATTMKLERLHPKLWNSPTVLQANSPSAAHENTRLSLFIPIHPICNTKSSEFSVFQRIRIFHTVKYCSLSVKWNYLIVQKKARQLPAWVEIGCWQWVRQWPNVREGNRTSWVVSPDEGCRWASIIIFKLRQSVVETWCI